MKIINLHKKCNRTKAVAKTAPKVPKSGYHLFLREQVDEMIGENQKSYRSFVSIELKETKQNPARLSEYNDRARQMQNEAEDSQNEKTMIDRPTAKHTKKYQTPLSLLMRTQMTQTMNKNLPQNSLKKHQKAQSLLVQARTMNKNDNPKKYQKPLSIQTMNKNLQ